MPSVKERPRVVRKVLSVEAMFKLRPRRFKAEGTARVKALGLGQDWHVGNIKEVSEAREWRRGW